MDIFKACVGAALGLMLVLQLNISQDLKENSHTQRVEELTATLQQREADNISLQRELDELKLSVGDVQKTNDFQDMKLAAGMAAMEGPGVIVKIDDNRKTDQVHGNQNAYLVHDADVLNIINELRAAGAEAISLNDQRLVATSEIRCAGPTLSVNNVRTAAPFEIRAIGAPKELANALQMPGGPSDTLRVWGIEMEIEAAEAVYVPAYKNISKFKYAKPAVQQQTE